MKDCKRPAIMPKRVDALLKDHPRSTKQIPFDICQQMGKDNMKETQDNNLENDQSKSEVQDTDQYSAEELFDHRSEDE